LLVVTDHIPNSEDPAVLQLIMCLLDAEGAACPVDHKIMPTVTIAASFYLKYLIF
jgi:hypothetical protein